VELLQVAEYQYHRLQALIESIPNPKVVVQKLNNNKLVVLDELG
jgi:hypothetical protein